MLTVCSLCMYVYTYVLLGTVKKIILYWIIDLRCWAVATLRLADLVRFAYLSFARARSDTREVQATLHSDYVIQENLITFILLIMYCTYTPLLIFVISHDVYSITEIMETLNMVEGNTSPPPKKILVYS